MSNPSKMTPLNPYGLLFGGLLVLITVSSFHYFV